MLYVFVYMYVWNAKCDKMWCSICMYQRGKQALKGGGGGGGEHLRKYKHMFILYCVSIMNFRKTNYVHLLVKK